MIYEPMDPYHDGQTRVLVYVGGTCNVEVQTLELILGQELFWEFVLDDSKQFALEADVSQLRANWTAAYGSGMAITCQIGVQLTRELWHWYG